MADQTQHPFQVASHNHSFHPETSLQSLYHIQHLTETAAEVTVFEFTLRCAWTPLNIILGVFCLESITPILAPNWPDMLQMVSAHSLKEHVIATTIPNRHPVRRRTKTNQVTQAA